jgi:hypothetical protein
MLEPFVTLFPLSLYIYIRYVYRLVNFHLKHQRNIEAGFTILLHSAMLQWRDSQPLEASDLYPAQVRERERERERGRDRGQRMR